MVGFYQILVLIKLVYAIPFRDGFEEGLRDSIQIIEKTHWSVAITTI